MADQRLKNISALILVIVLIGLGVYSTTRIKTTFSFLQFAIEDDTELIRYRQLHEPFRFEGKVLVVGIENDTPLTNIEEFRHLNNLVDSIERLDGVDTVHFLTNLDYPYRAGPEIINGPFLPLEDPSLFYERLKEIENYSDISRKFISKDKQAVCLYLYLNSQVDDQKLASQLHSLIDRTHHFIGYNLAKSKIESLLKDELTWLTLGGVLIMSIIFLVIYRSLKRLLFFFLIMCLSVSVFYILIWILGVELNIISASIPLLIAVISVSDTIHIIESYDKNAIAPYKNLGYALFYTSLTTAISFAVFLFTGNDVISNFALLTIGGIAMTFLIARYFARILFFLLEGSTNMSVEHKAPMQFSRGTNQMIAVGFIFLTLGMVYIVKDLKADHVLHKHLVSENDVSRANEFYFDHFDDQRKLEVFVVSDSGLFDSENIIHLQRLESYLFKEYEADHVESPLLAIKRYNRARLGGQHEYFSLPENLDSTYLNRILKYRDVLGLRSTLSKNKKVARFVAGSKDPGSSRTLEKNHALEVFLSDSLPANMTYLVGGPTSIQDKASLNITKAIYQGIIIALVLLFVITSIIYRSLVIGFASLMVNLFPLLVVALVIWSGELDLEPGNVMALSIILGIAVDDSIHFLSRLKLKFNAGDKMQSALVKTLSEIRRPIIITTLLLISGFAVFYFSSIEANHQNSLYFVAGLVAALVCDILFLPILISALTKGRKK